MKQLLTKNWPAKISSLIAAYVIWYVIHQHIGEDIVEKLTSEQAKDQQRLQQLLEQKMQEVRALQDKIYDANAEKALRAIPVPEEDLPPSEAPVPSPTPNKAPKSKTTGETKPQ